MTGGGQEVSTPRGSERGCFWAVGLVREGGRGWGVALDGSLPKQGKRKRARASSVRGGRGRGGGSGRRIVVVVAVGAGTGSDAGTEEAVRQHVRGG
jgi:hypothetical protein